MAGFFIGIGIVLAVITFFQCKSLKRSRSNISVFENIFPADVESIELIEEESVKDGYNVSLIGSDHKNAVFQDILSAINKYLKMNSGVISDFHLIKDIVDRNCDTHEEEIHYDTPIPIYWGLIGTMIGILLGVALFVMDGGLSDLFDFTKKASTESVSLLLGGVSLSMISSIIGILMTVYTTNKIRVAKSKLEKNKNSFLSWIQAELLPNTSTDLLSAMVEMGRNLNTFNEVFAHNTIELREILSSVNKSYSSQVKMLQELNKLNVIDIAKANILVYEQLKRSTNEIGVFADYLENANNYLDNIQRLTSKLDEYEHRTQIIESAGLFYKKNEKWLAENIDTANLEVQTALGRFSEALTVVLNKMGEVSSANILDFENAIKEQNERQLRIQNELSQNFELAISEQRKALQHKLDELPIIVEEIKNLKEIKESVQAFNKAISHQNKKIDQLTKEVQKSKTIKYIQTEGDYQKQVKRKAKGINKAFRRLGNAFKFKSNNKPHK